MAEELSDRIAYLENRVTELEIAERDFDREIEYLKSILGLPNRYVQD